MIDCSNCPEEQACCGIIIFEKEFIKNFEDKIEPGFTIEDRGDLIVYLYEDGRCPFLDRQTRKCKIYDSRLQVCKDYGYNEKIPCPYFKPSGNRRSKGSQTKIERDIDRKIKFFQDLRISPDVSLTNNTDGVYAGTLFEFKLTI